MKKFVSLIVAFTVCLTLGATVFAAGSPVATPIPTPPATNPTETTGRTPVGSVTIDDIPVYPEDITENEDGTVTIGDEAIERLGLTEGEHIVVVTYPDGTTRTYRVLIAFRTPDEATPDTAPQTSDLLIVPGLAAVALAGTTTAVVAKKKQ